MALDSLFSLSSFFVPPLEKSPIPSHALSLSLFLSLAVYGEGKISNEFKKKYPLRRETYLNRNFQRNVTSGVVVRVLFLFFFHCAISRPGQLFTVVYNITMNANANSREKEERRGELSLEMERSEEKEAKINFPGESRVRQC